MTYESQIWTNSSVVTFAGDDDPIGVMQAKVKETILNAADHGWNGPPYDPFHLADLLDVDVMPNHEVFDARTVTTGDRGLLIEFNPLRPHGRIRYSVAHEIAHTLFPDCHETVRNRERSGDFSDDDWQLELLCNLGAAEILMPSGYGDLGNESIDINNLLRLRSEFDVSTEAILLRMAKLTSVPCTVFAAARVEDTGDSSEFRIDYAVPSRSWPLTDRLSNYRLESSAVLAECTAVGFTAKGTESWAHRLPDFNVECVGIPSFPGNSFPRIIGVLTSEEEARGEALQIRHLFGDALEPRGEGRRIIAHIVNDGTPNWGGGFAREVGSRWDFIQDEFRDWVAQDRRRLALGNVHSVQIDDELSIVHMVAQRGYGPSNRPRLRYAALEKALEQLASIAGEQGASVHMPRIGAGQAGGSWAMINELIDESLVRRNIPVSIYTLPDAVPAEIQGMLNL